jgi:trehalose 6-phosphate phosphatase
MPKSLPTIDGNAAFFVDFDGTLVEIAAKPHLVHVEPRVVTALESLRERLGGAVAIVTGRPLDVVDRLLAPLILPTAAEHGLVHRDASGAVHVEDGALAGMEAARSRLQTFAEANPGLILERKMVSASLHYRQHPELGQACGVAAHAAIEGERGLEVLPGKMVFEVRPKGRNKGTAVEAFLNEPPFAGRQPIFAGDDVTDEDAFKVVKARGGISIKIGDGDTVADYRTDRDGLFAWAKTIAMP